MRRAHLLQLKMIKDALKQSKGVITSEGDHLHVLFAPGRDADDGDDTDEDE